MDRDDTLRIRNIDTGEEGDLLAFDRTVKDRIIVRSPDGGERSEFVLDWEPIEGHRQSMYEWLTDKEDALGTA